MAKGWNEVVWNEVVMERSGRNSARRFGSFGKLKKPTLFPLASTIPLWLQRGKQQLIFELELIPNEISSKKTVALKKSLLDDR